MVPRYLIFLWNIFWRMAPLAAVAEYSKYLTNIQADKTSLCVRLHHVKFLFLFFYSVTIRKKILEFNARKSRDKKPFLVSNTKYKDESWKSNKKECHVLSRTKILSRRTQLAKGLRTTHYSTTDSLEKKLGWWKMVYPHLIPVPFHLIKLLHDVF